MENKSMTKEEMRELMLLSKRQFLILAGKKMAQKKWTYQQYETIYDQWKNHHVDNRGLTE